MKNGNVKIRKCFLNLIPKNRAKQPKGFFFHFFSFLLIFFNFYNFSLFIDTKEASKDFREVVVQSELIAAPIDIICDATNIFFYPLLTKRKIFSPTWFKVKSSPPPHRAQQGTLPTLCMNHSKRAFQIRP